MKVGYVQLQIQGLQPETLEDSKQKGLLEDLFRDVYNELSGMCLDDMMRVLHHATIDEWDIEYGSFETPAVASDAGIPTRANITANSALSSSMNADVLFRLQ